MLMLKKFKAVKKSIYLSRENRKKESVKIKNYYRLVYVDEPQEHVEDSCLKYMLDWAEEVDKEFPLHRRSHQLHLLEP